MSNLDKLGIVIEYEFMKHIRRARLYIILGISLLAQALVLILVPTLMTNGYPKDVNAMAMFLTSGASLAALGAVFFAGDAIAGEYEQKTGFLLFTNPIKRETLWVGKYIAGFLAVAILMLFTYIITAVSLAIIYHQVPVAIFQSFGMALYYAAAVLSTTFLFSALSKGSMGATIMALLFLWVICGIVESVLAYTGNPYWFILSVGGDATTMSYGSIQDVMAGFGGLGAMGGGGQGMLNFSVPSLGMVAWGQTIYFVGCFVASIYFARRRQLA
jgi:ABC-2 type transport system permease protein